MIEPTEKPLVARTEQNKKSANLDWNEPSIIYQSPHQVNLILIKLPLLWL